MRDAVGQAQNAATTASNTAAGYGASASTIGSQLVPYLSRQLQNPSGMSQADIGAQLSAAMAGAGGATSGLAGAASHNAATTRNPIGFSAALDAAARSRDKAAAGASEGIAANNVNVKLQQQQQAAQGLQGLYGADVSAQNQASGQIANDVNAETNANNSGWLQNTLGIMNTIAGGANAAANLGWKPGCWVAAEVYNGWLDPRVGLVRRWIFGDFARTRVGGLAARAYLRWGERLAAAIRRYPALRGPVKRLMDCALRRAAQEARGAMTGEPRQIYLYL